MTRIPSLRSPSRYGAVAQALHWATAVLVLAAFIYGPGGPEVRVYAPERDFDRHLHETLGSAVFLLAFARVLWRLVDRRPAPAPASRWMELAAKAMQGVLMLLLFAVPLTAVCGAWLQGHPLAWLGGLQLAAPFTPSHELGSTLAEVHGWLGDVILWLAGAHALAAIYHQVLLRDGVLRTMLPRWLMPDR